jgi:hypothetical protein
MSNVTPLPRSFTANAVLRTLGELATPRCAAGIGTSLALALLLSACGGSGDNVSEPPPHAPPPAPTPTSAAIPGTPNGTFDTIGTAVFSLRYGVERYDFAWNPSAQATHYELWEDPDGPGPLPEVQAGNAITGTRHTLEISQPHQRVNASYRLRECNGTSCTFRVITLHPDVLRAYFLFDRQGSSVLAPFNPTAGTPVLVSADLKTLVIGAPDPVSTTTLPRPTPAVDDSAVHVFVRSAVGEAWQPQARLQASNRRAPACNNVAQDYCHSSSFGAQLALSADGNTLAVSATGETSNARGINGDQANTDSLAAGAVYVFVRTGGSWNQQAYVKASNTPARNNTWCNLSYWATQPCDGQNFGASVALSADGNLLAVGAVGDDSKSTGVNGDANDTSAVFAGAVHTYARTGSNWAPQAYLKASNTDAGDGFGTSVSLSADGSTLAVGAIFESSSATGVGGNQTDNAQFPFGAVYVFSQDRGSWSQQAYVKAPVNTVVGGTEPMAYFGGRTALSANGDTLAVGSVRGMAFVYSRTQNTWQAQAHMFPEAPNVIRFGEAVGVSTDGNTVATAALDVGSEVSAPMLYFFSRAGGTWNQ